MARATNRLSAKATTSRPPGLHADGNGLYLRVEAGGARRWIFIFRFGGKRREMGLGALQDVPLVEARGLALRARREVRDGIDPIAARQKRRNAAAPVCFGEFAISVVNDLSPGWRKTKTDI